MVIIGDCKCGIFPKEALKRKLFVSKIRNKISKKLDKSDQTFYLFNCGWHANLIQEFLTFSLSGEIPFGVIVLPRKLILVVPNSHLCAESFKPDVLRQLKIFRKTGISSSNSLTPVAISCVGESTRSEVKCQKLN